MTVLHRSTRLDVDQLDLPLLTPAQEVPAGSSGPLSQRIDSGFPRRSITSSSDRVTRRLDKLVSTSKEGFSLVKARGSLALHVL